MRVIKLGLAKPDDPIYKRGLTIGTRYSPPSLTKEQQAQEDAQTRHISQAIEKGLDDLKARHTARQKKKAKSTARGTGRPKVSPRDAARATPTVSRSSKETP